MRERIQKIRKPVVQISSLEICTRLNALIETEIGFEVFSPLVVVLNNEPIVRVVLVTEQVLQYSSGGESEDALEFSWVRGWRYSDGREMFYVWMGEVPNDNARLMLIGCVDSLAKLPSVGG